MSVMWEAEWEGSLEEKGHIHIYIYTHTHIQLSSFAVHMKQSQHG